MLTNEPKSEAIPNPIPLRGSGNISVMYKKKTDDCLINFNNQNLSLSIYKCSFLIDWYVLISYLKDNYLY